MIGRSTKSKSSNNKKNNHKKANNNNTNSKNNNNNDRQSETGSPAEESATTKKSSEGQTSFSMPQRFKSLLNQPFALWNQIESVVEKFLPEWAPTQRGRVVHNLLRFLELKVLMEDYKPNELLAPTRVVGQAWQALILETRLYRQVVAKMQAYHGRPKKMIHYSILRNMETSAQRKRLERTQALFQVYYQEMMMSNLAKDDASLTDTSTLTDGIYHWGGVGGVGARGVKHCTGKEVTCTPELMEDSYEERLGPPPSKRKRSFDSTFNYVLSSCLCLDLMKDTIIPYDDDYTEISGDFDDEDDIDDDDYSALFAERFLLDDLPIGGGGGGDYEDFSVVTPRSRFSFAPTTATPNKAADRVETKFIVDGQGRSFAFDLHL